MPLETLSNTLQVLINANNGDLHNKTKEKISKVIDNIVDKINNEITKPTAPIFTEGDINELSNIKI